MDLPAGTVLASRYRVLSQIGRGGMGAVFLVEHIHTGDRAALKLLHGASATDPESIERFKREARAPAKIQSENVVRVLDADAAPEIGGAPVLVMELLNGSDLQKIVARGGPLPPAEVVRVISQVARALDKAHSIGIVHRDLKPENLYLHQREDGTSVVKILDFGISKTMDSATATTPGSLTRTGAVMGTPLYMAPEQALGRRELIGPATDVWALGLIAIFLLTGEAYWQGNTVPDILGKVLSYAVYAPTSRWPALPKPIDAWLLRSCARTPEQRFTTAGEQVAALSEILRAATMSQVANAATMLPGGHAPTPMPGMAYPPSQQPWSGYAAPPNVTPPYVTPPYSNPPPPMPPMQMPYPPGVGGSTNEPFVHTARGMAPQGGTGLGVKLAVAFGVLLAFLGALAATIVVVGRYMSKSEADTSATTEPSETATAPTATQQVDVDASLAPLQVGTATATTPRPTATVTATAPATAHPTATATATATATTRSHAQCRSDCRAACVDANDMTECLTKCLRKCNAQ
ncbi:MAG TPA: serine/threonine-protein kinase [Polyangiaceae bacterium]|nr:serine/threonine-protein kinase [Polyangiaceae bacterium]